MTNPYTTNFDFPTVYEYKRLCIDHPVRNQKFLAWIGIPSHMLDKMDELLFLIVIVIIAFIVAGIVHAVLVHLAKKILKRKRVGFFESMFKYSVFRKLTAIIPPLMVSALLPFAFSKDSAWFILSEKITWIYFSSP